MTPEQILADLRDIHLPEADPGAAGGALVYWPLILVLLTIMIMAWFSWWRRSAWRRELVRDLAALEPGADDRGHEDAWARLAVLLRRFAIQRASRNNIAGLTGEPWLERLDQLFGVSLFTQGPGRGLISFPYQGQGHDEESDHRMVDDLRTTLATLRRRLAWFGIVG